MDQPGLDISGSLEEEGARKKNLNGKVGYDTELDQKFLYFELHLKKTVPSAF